MLLKIVFVVAFACLALADNTLESSQAFETSHKNPATTNDDDFQTSHKISPFYMSAFTGENADFGGLRFLRSAMNFAPTQARPALDPVLSALINEDVRKSIEAKRAIEQEELDAVRAEIDAAVAKSQQQETEESSTKAAHIPLTTAAPAKRVYLDDDINVGFVDQTISLDTAGSENNKKSRIEIKKGPNGQEYEYEYVYYYEDEDEDSSKVKTADTAAAQSEESVRGKSRYSSIDRSSNTATPTENSLISGKAKGRSSNVNAVADEIEAERLPTHTRFPNRGKNVEVQPTPAIDVQQEKKKISVKRPSLELVDSETFNTDEKQVKGSPRNGDTEAINKPTAAAQEQPARVEAISIDREETATAKIEADTESATALPVAQKSAFDLYAISINDKLNSDLTTMTVEAGTTALPETTDSEDSLTTLIESLPSSTTSSTTTTTTTEAPTTTAKPSKPSLFGNRRPGQGGSARFNRNKAKSAGESTSTTTEGAVSAEQTKPAKNRFSRPGAGGRSRPGARTTAAPAATEEEEEKVEAKEVKTVSSGFGRGRPRNRFNLRGSTTEKPAESADSEIEDNSSTTARAVRSRPTLNLRGRTRATTTKAPANEEDSNKNTESETEPKQTAAAPSKSSRFNLNRPGGNRLLPRGKYGRTTEHPASEDSAADSSHHNDIKNEENHEHDVEKTDKDEAAAAGNSLNRLKNRQRVNVQPKSDSNKSKAAAAPAAPRKVNPLLAKRRLQLGASTTEAAAVEDAVGTSVVEESEAKESTHSVADDNESAKEDSTEETETTTKQARGLGLLGQRRRLPLRKPGTIL